MTVVEKKPIPIYEVECHECHSKIQYSKAEVGFCSITCPVCGVSIQANTISPVRMEPPEEDIESGWISVKDRLPKGGDDSGKTCDNVCLLMDDGTVTCGWMNGLTKKVYFLNDVDDFVVNAPISRVTHWMPLPDPPKEAE